MCRKKQECKVNAVVTGLTIHLEKTLKMKYDMSENEMSGLVVVPKKYYEITGEGRILNGGIWEDFQEEVAYRQDLENGPDLQKQNETKETLSSSNQLLKNVMSALSGDNNRFFSLCHLELSSMNTD